MALEQYSVAGVFDWWMLAQVVQDLVRVVQGYLVLVFVASYFRRASLYRDIGAVTVCPDADRRFFRGAQISLAYWKAGAKIAPFARMNDELALYFLRHFFQPTRPRFSTARTHRRSARAYWAEALSRGVIPVISFR